MKVKYLYVILLVVLIIITLLMIFGGVYFQYDNMPAVGNFVSPLIGGLLGGIITVIGIELSHFYALSLQEKNNSEDRRPYLVIENQDVILDGEFDGRFPWGGDPPPIGCFEFWINDGPDACSRVYLLSKLKNIGYGLAQNISFYSKSDTAYGGITVSVIADKETDTSKIYFVIDSTPNGAITSQYIIEFDDYTGKRYSQTVTLSTQFHDYNLIHAHWASTRPFPISQIKTKKQKMIYLRKIHQFFMRTSHTN